CQQGKQKKDAGALDQPVGEERNERDPQARAPSAVQPDKVLPRRGADVHAASPYNRNATLCEPPTSSTFAQFALRCWRSCRLRPTTTPRLPRRSRVSGAG